jgi:outer membrane protein assembly factor BamB
MLQKSLRLWPGVVLAILLVVFRVLPAVSADLGVIGVLGPVLCGFAIILWWFFFSRAPWIERIGLVLAIAIAMLATKPFLHPSIVGGMMGNMFMVSVPPVLGTLFVIWAVSTRHLSNVVRRATMVLTIFVSCGVWLLARTDGVMGTGAQLHWRWTPNAEQRLLAQPDDTPALPSPPPAAVATPAPTPAETPKEAVPAVAAKDLAPPAPSAPAMKAEWPGFRGPLRDDIVRGVRINTDWTQAPPTQMWRRPIGPGWSSFAVSGDLIYTQEQRGADEVVACYRMSTGAPVWRHRDTARFWESNGGAGPRGTPTLSGGRIFSLGATGILNALDAQTGAVLWKRNAQSDTGATLPGWGFSGSPLVVDDLVMVAASGILAAYDVATGKPRWTGPKAKGGYSSPHLIEIDGVPQVLLINGSGISSVAPATGAPLWKHEWEAVAIVQPAVVGNGDILVSATSAMGGLGVRRLAVRQSSGRWSVEEKWTSTGLKPYFSDYVVHKGYAFGFDGAILSCIDLNDGARKWKGGRYGQGQLVLLADQDALLVISEEGELALVSATPDGFKELARSPGLEGKTWNHPVVVHDVLLVRNDQEMAAYRLPKLD